MAQQVCKIEDATKVTSCAQVGLHRQVAGEGCLLIVQHFSQLLSNTRVPMGQLDHFVLSNGKQVELAQAQSSLAAIWRNKLWAPFIPEGFPHSVTQDYTGEYASGSGSSSVSACSLLRTLLGIWLQPFRCSTLFKLSAAMCEGSSVRRLF